MTPEAFETMTEFSRLHHLDWGGMHDEVEDILTITPAYVGPQLEPSIDFWGIGRRTVHYSGGSYEEFVRNPLAEADTVAAVHRHPWPSPDWFDFGSLREQVLARDPEGRKAHRADILCSGNPLEIYTWMTGMETTFMNLLLAPDVVHAALRHITDFFAEMMRRTVDAVGDRIDIFYFADDLGGQETLLFSRDTYTALVKPYHVELIALSKSLLPSSRAMYHTDGAVYDIIPELIDAGVDILEAVQTDALGMDPTVLKSEFGDRLSFHGGISVQQLLPNATADEVRRECGRLIEVFGEGGGYIAAPSHSVQYGTPPENVFAMLETVLGEQEFEALCRRHPLE